MRTNKLAASMATTLSVLFVTICTTAITAVDAFKYVMSGVFTWTYLIPLAIALLTVLTLILALVGAVKASHNPQGKGLFVTVAIFQFLLFLAMGFYGGIYLYQSIVSSVLLELVLVMYAPYVLGAFLLFIAFIQTCRGVKRVHEEPAPEPEPAPRRTRSSRTKAE